MEKLKYTYPELYTILHYWPATVLLPCILLLIASLALITRWWDRRDAEAARERSRRANLGEGPPPTGFSG